MCSASGLLSRSIRRRVPWPPYVQNASGSHTPRPPPLCTMESSEGRGLRRCDVSVALSIRLMC